MLGIMVWVAHHRGKGDGEYGIWIINYGSTNVTICLLDIYECINSYTDEGIAHWELLLVTCFKRKTLRRIKTSSCQCVFCKVPCCLQYLKKKIKTSLCVGNAGVGGP